jgi:hypothetical protein
LPAAGWELLGLIEDCLQRLVPLALLKHHLNRYPVPDWVLVPSAAWVHQQVYLHLYPKKLKMRNHVLVRPPWTAEAGKNLLIHGPASLSLWHASPQNRGVARGTEPRYNVYWFCDKSQQETSHGELPDYVGEQYSCRQMIGRHLPGARQRSSVD